MRPTALELGPRAAFYWGYGHLLVYAGIAAAGVGVQLAIEGSVIPATEYVLAAGAPPAGEAPGGMRGILGGGVAVYLAAISFIHWVNRHSLDDQVLTVRLLIVGTLVYLAGLGAPHAPQAFAALVAGTLLALVVFETLRGAPETLYTTR